MIPITTALLERKKLVVFFAVVSGFLLNAALLTLCQYLELPLFMDSIFTVVIAALFGLVPGLIVGVCSNLVLEVVNGFPGFLWPFFVVNMATAGITHYAVSRKMLKTALGIFWTVLILALVNAILGAFLVTLLFGGITNQPMDRIVRSMLMTGQSIFNAALIGRVFINIVDKGIAVLVMLPLYNWYTSRARR